MRCDRCSDDVAGVAPYDVPQTSGFGTVPEPQWQLCPQCKATLDDAFAKIGDAVRTIGRTALDLSLRFNPFWAPGP